ncbi:MAG TPA: bifunctional diaminohydroxyphosphoribosylaminopyrimidine deaminase/5-amino-6-(5-phosphoribosylamino)uracil reductase RibD [Candidatus Acidoferrales bacterium]|nr:bifunctional diaminohydroxyphosphoribosylaminopyrimidine deaminase/5-amino-6-(5-phosphoribosylamino)uracil reductase RibD [Candidatus Acidoferrales bacterium]
MTDLKRTRNSNTKNTKQLNSVSSTGFARLADSARFTDEAWMVRALVLAHRGVALAHPNPMVGAVVVKNDAVAGEGFHTYEARKHAEIIALEQARANARRATLYVNLEPCCHTGRTGPCTKAIIDAGVKRVVVAMRDPNPAVAGRGIRELRAAGIEVALGVREDDARHLNEAFAKWIRTKLPFVTLKTALTLDGRIAARTGSTTWITSGASREEVQRMRHEADALLTGIGTVLADDPRMTDRTKLPRRKPLIRVIVDSRLRIPVKSGIVKSAKNDALIFTTQSHDSPKGKLLRKAGVEIVRIRSRGGHADLREVLREMGEREILSVILEAGSELNGAMLQANLIDKMVLFYAPKIMGDGGVPMAQLPSQWFERSPALSQLSFRRYGPDFAIQGYFHDVYRNH